MAEADIRARIADLEKQLASAKLELLDERPGPESRNGLYPTSYNASIHNLVLMADSALPLGSFAYSSGLESFMAHNRPLPAGSTPTSLFDKFFRLSIHSIAFTLVPYVLEGYRCPQHLVQLDNDLDASTPCTVARRASIAQGRALVSVWEKAFAKFSSNSSLDALAAATAIEGLAKDLKGGFLESSQYGVNAHLAPLWGAMCRAADLSLDDAAYLFLLNHAKAVVSAAVRASVMGPYKAQNVLASTSLQQLIRSSLEKVWLIKPEDAGQVVPPMDLWIGRHEILYTRIFNS